MMSRLFCDHINGKMKSGVFRDTSLMSQHVVLLEIKEVPGRGTDDWQLIQ